MRTVTTSVLRAGLALGVLADVVLGDPRRLHPVAGFGRAAGRLEVLLHADDRARGVLHLGLAVGPPVAAAALVEHRLRRLHAPLQVAVIAGATWACVGTGQLWSVAASVHRHLLAGDVDAARSLMPSLVGRDPRSLDVDGMVRATVESVAENTADAAVGTLLWGAVGGLPGIVAHRVVNTLDAMVGHRSPRYARFGTAAAVTDDVLGILPARLTALLCALLAPAVGGRPGTAVRIAVRDGGRHPSPNAGPVEAAMAGALGVTLGGPLRYAGREEVRGRLGSGPTPAVADIPRAVRLSVLTTVAATATAAVLAGARMPRGGRMTGVASAG